METQFTITGITNIIYVGADEYREKSTSFTPVLPGNELIFNLSGRTKVWFHEKLLETTPDTLRFLPAGVYSRYDVERMEPGACIDIFFTTDTPLSPEALLLTPSQPQRLRSLFNKIFSVWVAKNEGYYFECMSLLYQIFSEIQKQNYLPEKQYQLIRPAMEYIRNHFLEESISAETLSKLCGISYSYIKQLFNRKYGMTPKKYAIYLRIHYACDLLRSRYYTVTQVAELSGYSDLGYFSRQFKESMGITPREYLEKYTSSR